MACGKRQGAKPRKMRIGEDSRRFCYVQSLRYMTSVSMKREDKVECAENGGRQWMKQQRRGEDSKATVRRGDGIWKMAGWNSQGVVMWR